ncbi:hypothetical protein AB0C02_27995 [Micromonospora sp. NPDC048999]|uniref:hypothetical protein n=1 Tax=Micromonospora sp. NPDC048999 TaxID=3155391 RepID=UPI0033E78F7B
MTAQHGSSGLAGYITMLCLAGLPDCVDEGCVCRCHDFAGHGEPVCGATNTVVGLTCNRRPHPPGTAHYQLDGSSVRAWPRGEP